MATTRWRRADDRTKSSVFGYMRRIESNSKKIRVPLAIKCYCISYYYLNDHFTHHGDNIIVNKSGNTASGKREEFQDNLVYGNEIINLSESLKMVNHRYKWTFKVSQTDVDCPGFWIGINDSNKKHLNDPHKMLDDFCHGLSKIKSYSLTHKGGFFGTEDGGKWGKYLWGKEGLIEMELIGKKVAKYQRDRDLLQILNNPVIIASIGFTPKLDHIEEICEWEIIFSINGVKATDIIKTVEPSAYHLAVGISMKGQSIEILKFEFHDK